MKENVKVYLGLSIESIKRNLSARANEFVSREYQGRLDERIGEYANEVTDLSNFELFKYFKKNIDICQEMIEEWYSEDDFNKGFYDLWGMCIDIARDTQKWVVINELEKQAKEILKCMLLIHMYSYDNINEEVIDEVLYNCDFSDVEDIDEMYKSFRIYMNERGLC